MAEKPQKTTATAPASVDAPAKWRKQKTKARSFYQLHHDLYAVVSAWHDATQGDPGEHTISELMGWSANRTLGALMRPE